MVDVQREITAVFSVSMLTEPIFYFGDVQYSVDESSGYVEVQVWRTGSDLSRPSSVTVRSRKMEPPSADGEQSAKLAFCVVQQHPATNRFT